MVRLKTTPSLISYSFNSAVTFSETNSYLEIFESRVLSHPIGAHNTQSFGHSSTHSLLSDGLMVAAWLQFVDTVVLGLAVCGTCRHRTESRSGQRVSIDRLPLGTCFLRPPRLSLTL